MKRTLVNTSCEANLNSKEKIKGDGQASSHPVTVQGAEDLKDKTESDEAPKTLKNTKGFEHDLVNANS